MHTRYAAPPPACALGLSPSDEEEEELSLLLLSSSYGRCSETLLLSKCFVTKLFPDILFLLLSVAVQLLLVVLGVKSKLRVLSAVYCENRDYCRPDALAMMQCCASCAVPVWCATRGDVTSCAVSGSSVCRVGMWAGVDVRCVWKTSFKFGNKMRKGLSSTMAGLLKKEKMNVL